jgi:Tol biopolymer transport system component
MNADGTDLRQLTSGPRVDLSPAWSPDGTRIAFSDLSGSLFVVDVATSQVTSLTTYVFTPKAQGPDDEPTWSPDGTKIAFSRNDEEGVPSIFVMDADGSKILRLTDPDPGADVAPDWSPDGTQVVFARTWNQNHPSDIYVVDVDGTGLRQLTTNSATDAAPAWSPDGTKIAFTSDRDGRPGDPYNWDAMDLYAMNPDGTNLTRITVDAHLGYSTDGFGAVDWRPAP